MTAAVPAVLALIGVLAIVAGLWMVWPPLAIVLTGVALMWVAVRLEDHRGEAAPDAVHHEPMAGDEVMDG